MPTAMTSNLRNSDLGDDLPLEELCIHRSDAEGAHLPDAAHRERVQELIERPASPAPFPEVLPARPLRSRPQKWIITTGVLALLLSGFVTATAILAARVVRQTNAAPAVIPSPVTVTSIPKPSATTVTFRETATNTQTVVEICNQDLNHQDWFISKHYCAIVDCNNAEQADIWQNDCKNFCRDQTFCSLKPDLMSSRLKECCSHCDC